MVGGTTASDLIRLDGTPTVPLRNAGVIRGSESVNLEGRQLRLGDDYSLDCPTGMLILKVATKPGQVLRVTYRHDPAEARSSASKFGNGLNTMKLSFGQSSVMMGLGMAERGDNGKVMRSDLYGLKTSFGLTPGGSLRMNGMFAYSSRKTMQSQSLMGESSGLDEGGQESGTAIVQEIGGDILGGKVALSYQAIDRKFTGFSAFSDSGYSDQEVSAFTKERGLKRMGLSLKDIMAGSLKLNQSYQVVGEGGNSITNQSYGIAGTGWSLSYSSREVDSGFNRFNDLRESDRKQLEKERGLRTNSFGLNFDQRGAKFSLTDFNVSDQGGNAVQRMRMSFQTGTLTMAYVSQEVGQGFGQFEGLREADRGQLARERGISRTAWNLGWATKGFALSYGQSDMSNGTLGFSANNLTVTGANWNYELQSIGNDQGFDGAARQSEAEQNDNMARIAAMYQPKGIQIKGEDRHWFTRPSGLTRTSQRLSFSPGKGIGLSVSDLQLEGSQDSGRLVSGTLDWGRTKLSYRHQTLGENLVELSSLMGFERERLGSTPGLEKTDTTFSTSWGAGRSLEFNSMAAQVGDASASRRSLRIQDPRLELAYSERKVDASYFNVATLVDPERELLGQMIGQEQRQLLVNVMLMRGLNVRMNRMEANNASLDQKRSIAESLLTWDIDKDTKLQWYKYGNSLTDPEALLLDQSIDRLLLSRNFSNFGAVRFEREVISNGGTTATSPDSTRNSLSAEAVLATNTNVRTEQTRTEYGDGNTETISAHTLSTGFNARTGVSVTDVNIRRTHSDRPNESRRNYGFWINLGGGVKFTYGYARELGLNDTMNSNMSLTGGTFGGIDFGGANYTHQAWGQERDRSTGNFKLGTSKPIQLGFIKDFRFAIGSDTIRDYNLWQRENQTGSVGLRIGDLSLGYDYASQVHTNGRRAIDRTYRFSTPKDDSRKLSFDAMIKSRQMPWDKAYMIRNVSVTARYIPGFDLTFQTQTYPEQPRGDALLGTIVQPTRTVAYRLQQRSEKANTLFGAAWEERINDDTRQLSRIASVNLTLNARNPSPIRLSYGLEQTDINGLRRTMHRYGLEFSQRPGPNQLLNLNVGNVSWAGHRESNVNRDNWTLRMEYQLRF
ncbi:MAG: hypothetical protein JNK63_01170 [Chthonomonas sp.]|nr:hypothetical protein [Chthonomonas sp.]